jgi:hypothetical protein
MKLRLVFILLGLLAGETVFSQEKYGELTVSPVEELTTVVRNDTQAVLIIISEVPDLQVESTRQIFETRQRGASEWQLLVEPDSQSFTIQAPSYLPVKTGMMHFQAKRAYRLKVSQVKPSPGTLIIKTKPEGASVRLNGAPLAAKTPYHLEETLPASYYVQIEKAGYLPKDTTLIVESAKVTFWETPLIQTAVRVRIDIQNQNLREVGILINGEAKGIAPGTIYLAPGQYKLMLHKERYRYKEKLITITLGQEEIRLSEKLTTTSPFYKKWWFAGVTGGVVGGIALYMVINALERI